MDRSCRTFCVFNRPKTRFPSLAGEAKAFCIMLIAPGNEERSLALGQSRLLLRETVESYPFVDKRGDE
jgi:hypothetical protein